MKKLEESLKQAEAYVEKKYPELDKIAKHLSQKVAEEINHAAKNVKSEMPYKAQYILEELIKLLQEKV